MKILFLSQRVPFPPDRGDRITTWHFLSHLHASGHELRIGCLAEDDADVVAAAELQRRIGPVAAPRIDRRVRKVLALRALLTGAPMTLPFFRVAALQRRVDRWLAEDPPDLVYVYSSSMAQYVTSFTRGRRVMQFAELDSDKWAQIAATRRGPMRWLLQREARTLLRFETEIARSFDLSFVVSEVERDLFVRRIPGVTPRVLRNGVDVDHFTSAGDARREPHTCVFTGVMDYEPNVDGVLWFVAECWPALRQRHPDARFLVVGSRPSAAIRALDGRDGIEVTGRVPTTPPFFDRAAVAVAPLRLARGVQNKVLEAMSMAVPVVATTPAARGLGDVPADTLLVADDAASTVAAITRLFEDPTLARTIGQRAATFVRQHFRWEVMYADLDAALRDL